METKGVSIFMVVHFALEALACSMHVLACSRCALACSMCALTLPLYLLAAGNNFFDIPIYSYD